MEREAIARERRRHQAVEHLEFEHERETALRDQLGDVIAEQLGPQVDEQAFAAMSAEDAAVVREAIVGPDDPGEEDEEFRVDWEAEPEQDEAEAVEAEIARLQGEIEESRRRQRAFQSYVDALGGGS